MSITFFMGAGPAVKPVRQFFIETSADAGELGLVPVTE